MEHISSEEMLGFLEHAPTTVFLVDEEARVLYCNHHALTSFGIKNKDAFGAHFFSNFSTSFQSSIVAKDFMTIQIAKAMSQGIVRFPWTIKRDFHESPSSIRLVRVQYEGKPCCIAYLTEFDTGGGTFFDEPLERSLLDDKAWSILDSMPTAWSFTDHEMNILDCNMAAVKLFQAKNKQELLPRYSEIFPEFQSCGRPSMELALEYVEKAMVEGKAVVEFEHKSLEGEYLPVEVTLVRVGLKNRFIISVFMRDLREQRELEMQKALEDARLQAILQNIPAAIHLWSGDNEMLFCNEQMADVFGFSNTDEYRAKFLGIFPKFQPDGKNSLEHDFRLLREVFETGQPQVFEWVLLDKNGKEMFVERSFFRIKYGDSFAILEFCRDLRHEKEKAELVRKESERFKLFFNSVPVVCTFWDEHHELIMGNVASAQLFNLSSDQEFIYRFYELSPLTQPCGTLSTLKFVTHLEAAFEEGYAEFEWMHRIPSTGEEVPTIVSLTRTEFEGRLGVIGLTIDQRAHFEKREMTRKESERFKLFFHAVPVPCMLWNENRQLAMCNPAAAKAFKLPTPQDVVDNFFGLMPEIQPDGRLTSQMAKEHLDKAFKDGFVEFQVLHYLPHVDEEMLALASLTRIEFEGRPGLVGVMRDLREDIEKENMLIKDKERFKKFFDVAPAICTVWNHDRKLVLCNEFAYKAFDLSSVEEYLARFGELSPALQPCGMPSREKASAYVNEGFVKGFVEFEWMHQKPNGDPFPAIISLVRIDFEEQPHLLGFAIDQREQNAHTEMLLREKERFEKFFNNVPAVCTFWDENRNLSMCNHAAAELFGLDSPQEYLDRFPELSPPVQPCGTPSFEKAMSFVEEAFTRGFSSFDWMHQKPDGTPIPAIVSLTHTELDGKPALIGITYDKREQHARDLAFQEQIDRMNSILEHIPVPMQIWDKEHRAIFANPAVMELFDVADLDEYLESHYNDYVETQPDGTFSLESANEAIDIAFEQGRHKIEWTHKSRKGEVVPLECELIRINYGSQDVVLELAYDLREEKAKEAELQGQIDRFNAVLDHSPATVHIWSEDRQLVFANNATFEFYGFDDLEDYIGNMSRAYPEFQPCGTESTMFFYTALGLAFELGRNELMWLSINELGEQVPLRCSMVRMQYGAECAVVVFANDMRQELRELEERKETEQKLGLYLEYMPFAASILDMQLNILETNSSTFKLFGYDSKEEYIENFHKTLPELQPDGTNTVELFGRYHAEFANVPRFSFECVLLAKDGTSIPCKLTTTVTELGGETVTMAFLEDMRVHLAMNEEQRLMKERLRAMLDASPNCCFITDDAGLILDCNTVALELFGTSNLGELNAYMKGLHAEEQVDGKISNKAVLQKIAAIFKSEERNFEWIFKNMAGESIPTQVSAHPMSLGDKDVAVLYVRDMRESIRAEQERAKNQERMVALLNSSPVAGFVLNSDFELVVSNLATRELLGVKNTEKITSHGGMFAFLPEYQPDDMPSEQKLKAFFEETFRTKHEMGFEWVWKSLADEAVPVHVTLKIIELEGVDHIIGHMQDLRQLHKVTDAAAALEKMAYTDALTGAFNRRYMDIECTQMYENCVQQGLDFTLLVMDIDNFKTVNDTHGHKIGDEVLKILVGRVGDVLRKFDAVIRYGGEEFVVMMPETNIEDGKKVACRIKWSITHAPFITSKLELPITVSMGVATKEDSTPAKPYEAIAHIIDTADNAMYYSKHNGKNMVISSEKGEIITVDCGMLNEASARRRSRDRK